MRTTTMTDLTAKSRMTGIAGGRAGPPANSRVPHGLAAMLLVALTLPAWAEEDAGFLLTGTESNFASYFPTYLANGYASTLSAPRGTEGTPTYLVAFMDYTRDDVSRPAAIPGWTEIDYSTGPGPTGQAWLNRTPLRSSRFLNYRQTLNMREATLTTRYDYLDGTRRTAIEVRTFVDEASPHLAASQLSITPDFDGTVELSFALNLWAPHRPRLPLAEFSGPQMEEAVAAHEQSLQPIPPATPDRAAIWYHGDSDVSVAEGDAGTMALWLEGKAAQGLSMAEAATIGLGTGVVPAALTIYKSPYRLAQNFSVKVRKNQTYTFSKFVAFSRSGWGGDARADLELATAARSEGFDHLLAEHRDAWERLWRSDILIEGDARAQLAVHSELYYLLASSTPDTSWALGACGMTPGYAGHVFWDGDAWIFPALLLLHPERAKSLVMFRARTLGAAQARAHERGYAGAMYPWESDPENGSEQTPHFAYVLGEREIHVNSDIAIAQWQYYLATLDRDWLKAYGWPVIREVARFWASRVKYVPERHRYEILHVTSVNEPYNDIPNDTFTNVFAARVLSIAASAALLVGEQGDPRWADIARRMYVPTTGAPQHHLPFDPTVLVDADNVGGSVVLLNLPSLDLPMSEQLRRSDFEYALPRRGRPEDVSNSMGLAPNSITAAAVGDTADAAGWFQGNFSSGTLKPPFSVRTETASNNTGYFLTGSGGYIQNLLYGFSGLRIREPGLVEAYPPVLPAEWKSLTLENIAFRGQHYNVIVSRDEAGRARLARLQR